MTCKGTGISTGDIFESVNIPAGKHQGQSLRVIHKEDLLLKFSISPHGTFKREGNDIVSNDFIGITPY